MYNVYGSQGAQLSDRSYVRPYGRITVRFVNPYVRTSGRRAARFAGKSGVGGGILTKVERAARVRNKAERAARFHFIIFSTSNLTLAQPSAQRESENTLGVAPFSLTGRNYNHEVIDFDLF